MQVILTKDVSKLGKAGALIEVSAGHARNYLIPQGLAVEATPGKLSSWKAEQARLEAKAEKDRKEAEEQKKELEGKAVRIIGRAGESNGKLFGSITSVHIAEALQEQYGVVVDKRDVKLDETVKSAGNYKFSLKLYPNVHADMMLIVTVA